VDDGTDATAAPQVAPTAQIESGALVGSRTTVWDFAHVRAGARVGSDCTVGRGVFIDTDVVVGDRCKIQNHALLYRPARLEMGVFIGPGVVLTNDRRPRAITAGGRAKTAADWDATGVTIGEGAALGANATVVAGVTIGPWALVGAGAVVSHDVLPFALVLGTPARRVGWVGRGGCRLVAAGTSRWRDPETGEEFREADGRIVPS
jgi:UDP-2-acetamido-3-amino-2,3-dideoxy-glucuronate N-acetyltransferase